MNKIYSIVFSILSSFFFLSACSEKVKLNAQYSLGNGETVTVQLGKPKTLSVKSDFNVTTRVGIIDGDYYSLELGWNCSQIDMGATYIVEHKTDQFIDLYDMEHDVNRSICCVSVPIHEDYIDETHFFRLIENGHEAYSFNFVLTEVSNE